MSPTTLDNRYLNTATGEAGQKQLQAVLSWQHRKGTTAYCLAQVSSHPENGSVIAVLSEIEFSYGENTLTNDYVGAAKALIPIVERELSIGIDDIDWYIHFGIYFYFASPIGDEVCRVVPEWDLKDDEEDTSEMQRLLLEQAVETLSEYGITIDSGETTLESLGWDWKRFKRSSER